MKKLLLVVVFVLLYSTLIMRFVSMHEAVRAAESNLSFKEIVEEEERGLELKKTEAEAQLQAKKSRKSMGRIITLGMILTWFLGTWLTYRRYDKEYTLQFTEPYYDKIPSLLPPGEVSALMNCTSFYAPEMASSLLALVRSGFMRLDVFPGIDGRNRYGFIRDNESIKDVNLSESDQFLTDWLFDKLGDGEFISLQAISAYAKNQETSAQFQDDYAIWVSQLTDLCELDGFIDKRNSRAKVISMTFGCIYIIACIVLIYLTGTYVPVILVPLGAISILRVINLLRRSALGQAQYEKWLGYKRYLMQFDPAAVAGKSPQDWEEALVYACALGVETDLMSKLFGISGLGNSALPLLGSFEEDTLSHFQDFFSEFSHCVARHTSRKPKKRRL